METKTSDIRTLIESVQTIGISNPIVIDDTLDEDDEEVLVEDSLDEDDEFDDLIPEVNIDENSDKYAEIKQLEKLRSEKIGMDALPEETFNLVLETCFKQGGYSGFRDALYFVVQANWGVRCSDARVVKHIDFINEKGKFRESCLFSEIKTKKPRTMYINKAIKKCVLMVLWNGDFEPLDYLIRAKKYRNYKKVISPETGKILRIKAKPVYVLDENGEKILEPLTTSSVRKIMSKKLVDDLGIQLKGHKNCKDGKFKYATHSLRKLYSEKIEMMFFNILGDSGKAHIEAMNFLQWDLNHTKLSTTTRYCGIYDRIKKQLVKEMNLGLEVIDKYYEIEKEKHLAQKVKCINKAM